MIRAGSVGRKDTRERIEFDEHGEEFDVCGDNDWDEKGRTMISHIYVSFDSIIRSLQFGYTENEALTLSKKYGPSEGFNFKVVRLDQDEYVTGLSGSLGYHGGITSLIFHTNRGKHGPFANDDTNPRRAKIEVDPGIRDRCEFGGFFGSYCSGCITSIGIYVNPI
ncbi:jacalin-related lectin 24-like isoform X1 [Raphanus sativus]|uniref:Jacalin-related lectin 24-like isoform X1 n=1 Tax=Raphanus sativus TaxID=3726 RepID=A0A6J0MXG6_RAPSA|nr:jacalin-related lectin 24-like isoform X1 [Raphanus sativus]